MPLELLVRLTARLRALDEAEFLALKALVESGDEVEEHLPAVTVVLEDCCRISDRYNDQPRMRLVR